MIELNQTSDVNQLVNNIKKEISQLEPSYSRIKTYLTDLQTKEEFKFLSDTDFFDIVGETFKLIPELFMKNRFHSNYLPSSFPEEKRKQMARHIIEKHSLYDEEKIIHECDANIKMIDLKTGRTQVIISINNGHLIITNNRIIVQGGLEVVGGRGIGSSSRRDAAFRNASHSERCRRRANGSNAQLDSDRLRALPTACSGTDCRGAWCISPHVRRRAGGGGSVRRHSPGMFDARPCRVTPEAA